VVDERRVLEGDVVELVLELLSWKKRERERDKKRISVVSDPVDVEQSCVGSRLTWLSLPLLSPSQTSHFLFSSSATLILNSLSLLSHSFNLLSLSNVLASLDSASWN